MRNLLDEPIDVSLILDLRGGVYLLLQENLVVYVGETYNLLKRIYEHQTIFKRAKEGKATLINGKPAKPIRFNKVLFVPEDELRERKEIEWLLIDKHKPKYNINGNRIGSRSALERRGLVDNETQTGKGAALLESLNLK
jgi:excinuclease UvrABC nuclease subunit